jgi:hypothetical protein
MVEPREYAASHVVRYAPNLVGERIVIRSPINAGFFIASMDFGGKHFRSRHGEADFV